MISVPVPDLLQITHPGYRYIKTNLVLFSKDLPTYVDYCRRLIERFEHYGELSITPPEFFKQLTENFKIVFKSDEPDEFIPARELLIGLLEEFDMVIDNMQKAFSNNPRICVFYKEVASTLRQTFEYHIIGWDNDGRNDGSNLGHEDI